MSQENRSIQPYQPENLPDFNSRVDRQYEPFSLDRAQGGYMYVVTNPELMGKDVAQQKAEFAQGLNDAFDRHYAADFSPKIANQARRELVGDVIEGFMSAEAQPLPVAAYVDYAAQFPELAREMNKLFSPSIKDPVGIVLGHTIEIPDKEKNAGKKSKIKTVLAKVPFRNSNFSKSRVYGLFRHGENRKMLSLAETRGNNFRSLDNPDIAERYVNWIYSIDLHEALVNDQETDITLAEKMMAASEDYYKEVSDELRNSDKTHKRRSIRLSGGSNVEDVRLAVRALLLQNDPHERAHAVLPSLEEIDARTIVSSIINDQRLAKPLHEIAYFSTLGSTISPENFKKQLDKGDRQLREIFRKSLVDWSDVVALMPSEVKPYVMQNVIRVANSLADLLDQEDFAQQQAIEAHRQAEGVVIEQHRRDALEDARLIEARALDAGDARQRHRELTADREYALLEAEIAEAEAKNEILFLQLAGEDALRQADLEETTIGIDEAVKEWRFQVRAYYAQLIDHLRDNGQHVIAGKFADYAIRLIDSKNMNQLGYPQHVDAPQLTSGEIEIIDADVQMWDGNSQQFISLPSGKK